MGGETPNSEKFDVRPFLYRLSGFVLDGLLKLQYKHTLIYRHVYCTILMRTGHLTMYTCVKKEYICQNDKV